LQAQLAAESIAKNVLNGTAAVRGKRIIHPFRRRHRARRATATFQTEMIYNNI